MNTTTLQHSVCSSSRNRSRHTEKPLARPTQISSVLPAPTGAKGRWACVQLHFLIGSSKSRQLPIWALDPPSSSSSTTTDDSSSSSSSSGHTTTASRSSGSDSSTASNSTSATPPASEGSAGLVVGLPPPCDLGGSLPQSRWNAVSLAYLGDAVWEAYLRTYFYSYGGLSRQPEQQHSTVKSKANTHAQATCYRLLLSEGWPSGPESELMRWAANSSSVAPPKHATRQQYKQATALEALVGHLYLTDNARLQELMAWVLEPSRVGQWRSVVVGQQQAGPTSSIQQGTTPAPSKVQQGGRRRRGQQP